MPPDLSTILTPALFKDILAYTFPWKGRVDVAYAGKLMMLNTPSTSSQVYDTIHFRVLKPLSSLRPTVPYLERFLPPIRDPNYPEHVLALILLVDQGPRHLYSHGMDIEWVYGYFDAVSKDFVKSLLAKGAFQIATSTKRWLALGYSFEDAQFRKFLMFAPFIHSEDVADHDLITPSLEIMRKEIEEYSGRKDPGRATRQRDLEDTLLFSQMFADIVDNDGPPKTFSDFFFWIFRLYDAHYPVVKQFGRYPYRNEGNGRKYTQEEVNFMKETDSFGKSPITKKEAKRLAENIANGVWEELSDERPL